MYAGGADLSEILNELNTPKPKFVEGRPDNLERLLQQAGDLTSYELRGTAVNSLGKHKCDESIAAPHDRLSNDPVYDVRETAYLRLVRFGVEAKIPRKDAPDTGPEMNKKISHVVFQLNLNWGFLTISWLINLRLYIPRNMTCKGIILKTDSSTGLKMSLKICRKYNKRKHAEQFPSVAGVIYISIFNAENKSYGHTF